MKVLPAVLALGILLLTVSQAPSIVQGATKTITVEVLIEPPTNGSSPAPTPAAPPVPGITKTVSLKAPTTPVPTPGSTPAPTPAHPVPGITKTVSLKVPTTAIAPASSTTTSTNAVTTQPSTLPPSTLPKFTKTKSLPLIDAAASSPASTSAPCRFSAVLTRDEATLMTTEDLVIGVRTQSISCGPQAKGLEYNWVTVPTLPTTTSSNSIGTKPSQLFIPSGTFPAGTRVLVSCTVRVAGISWSLSVPTYLQAQFEFVAPPITVSILGGSRTVPSSGFTISSLIEDLSTTDGVDFNQITWSCSPAPTSCPSSLKAIPNRADLIASEKVPEGIYRISLIYRDLAEKSTSVIITVKDSTLDVELTRVITSSTSGPGVAHLASEPLEIFAIIPTPASSNVEPKVTEWRVGSVAVQSPQKNTPVGYSFSLSPEQIRQYLAPGSLSLTISCSAASGSDVTGRGEIVVPLTLVPTDGVCYVVRSDVRVDAPAYLVSGTLETLRTEDWSFPQTAGSIDESQKLQHAFGYSDPDTELFTPFSTVPADQLDVEFTVPFVRSPSTEVKFGVQIISAGRVVAFTFCDTAKVYPPANVLDVVTDQVNAMDTAATSGDSRAMLESALVAVGGLFADSATNEGDASSGSSSFAAEDLGLDSGERKTRRGQLRKKVVAVLKRVYGSASSGGANQVLMSTDERKSTVTVLAQIIRCSRSDQTLLDSDEKASVSAIVDRVLSVNKASDLDTKNQAHSLLDIIADAIDDKTTQKNNCRKLADMTAKNLGLGHSLTAKNNKFSLKAEKKAMADIIRAPIVSENSEVQINSGCLKKLETSSAAGNKNKKKMKNSSAISVSTVEFNSAPVASTPDEDLPLSLIEVDDRNKRTKAWKLCSRAIEYDLQWDSNTVDVSDLDEEDALQMKSKVICLPEQSRSGISSRGNMPFQVVFYNTTKGKWTTEGVENGDYDASTNTFSSKTRHFSLFAISYEEELEKNTTTNSVDGTSLSLNADQEQNGAQNFNQDALAAQDSTQKTSMNKSVLLVVIILSVVFVLVLIIAVCVLKFSNRDDSTASSSHAARLKRAEIGDGNEKKKTPVAIQNSSPLATAAVHDESLNTVARPPSSNYSGSQKSWTSSLEFDGVMGVTSTSGDHHDSHPRNSTPATRSVVTNDIHIVEECV